MTRYQTTACPRCLNEFAEVAVAGGRYRLLRCAWCGRRRCWVDTPPWEEGVRRVES